LLLKQKNGVNPMAHIEQLQFFGRCFDAFPDIFKNSSSRIIDLGSLDINGGPHRLLQVNYIGSDIGAGPNVDLVCPSQELGFETGHFDASISSECFEHNPFWRESLGQMARLTRSGGVVVWSAAGIGRAIHGTSTSKDNGVSAPFVATSSDYYRNLDARTALRAINHEGWYSRFVFLENLASNDTYFVGLRPGSTELQEKAMQELIDDLIEFYGDVSKFRIRRFAYKIGAHQVVESYFNMRRFITVIKTADKKFMRAKRKLTKLFS
jgi:SAM-dependent methyltransferase